MSLNLLDNFHFGYVAEDLMKKGKFAPKKESWMINLTIFAKK